MIDQKENLYSKYNTDDLNDYGKQLYWMGHGIISASAELRRILHGKDKEQDEFLEQVFFFMTRQADSCMETLDKLAQYPTDEKYKVLKKQ